MKPGVEAWRLPHPHGGRSHWIVRSAYKTNGPHHMGIGFNLVEAMREYLKEEKKGNK